MTVVQDHTFYVGNSEVLTHNVMLCKPEKNGNGLVSTLAQVTQAELDTARYLARERGYDIVIRGEGVKGADFIINGKLWEAKKLNSPSKGAVANRIKDSIKGGNQVTRFVIDGYAAGLSKKDFLSGIANAIRDKKAPS